MATPRQSNKTRKARLAGGVDATSESLLKKGLAALERETAPGDQHLAFPLLTAYLDRQLGEIEINRVEGHLAVCSGCRMLTSEAALALQGTQGIGQRLREWFRLPAGLAVQPWQAALAAAAVVLVGIVAVQVRRPDAGGAIDAEIQARVDQVRSGHLPAIADLASFADPAAVRPRGGGDEDPSGQEEVSVCGGGSLTSLRPSSNQEGGVSEPLAPRCSVILDNRPSFVWRPGQNETQRGTRYAVTLFDRQQEPIEELPYSPPNPTDAFLPLTLSLPQDRPALKSGQIYSWRVTATLDERQDRSIYVPFRIADPALVAVLGNELSRAGHNSYRRAVVFAWHGLYGEALKSLSEVPKDQDSHDLVHSLALLILQRQGLRPTELSRELETAR